MMNILNFIILITLALIAFKLYMVHDLAAENRALRQQLAALNHKTKRPRLRLRDRVFWVLLSKFWSKWRDVLVIVQPETVVKWHRQGFKLFWRFKSRRKGPGKPPIAPEVRKLILEMAMANPTWGAPRIHGELMKLGIEISQRTVSNYMPKARPKPPSQTWRTFLKNHIGKCSMDFFTVPTAGFRVRYVHVILNHERRKVVHFNVTSNPTAEWTAQQVVEAFPWDTAPKYLMRDRDSIYSKTFTKRVKGMGIEE
ncbi:MAG: helix-turn-helix domain-containing protein, partial [Proteobacteria bacterium]|nr:helix-turn-helix domain-containing protein [Pseudomonadota bacterium]